MTVAAPLGNTRQELNDHRSDMVLQLREGYVLPYRAAKNAFHRPYPKHEFCLWLECGAGCPSDTARNISKLKPPVPDVPKVEYDIDFVKQEANSNL